MTDEELVERLREENTRLGWRSLEKGCVDSGIASTVAFQAADAIERLTARAKSAENGWGAAADTIARLTRERDEARAALHKLHDDLYEEFPWLFDAPQMKEARRALATQGGEDE